MGKEKQRERKRKSERRTERDRGGVRSERERERWERAQEKKRERERWGLKRTGIESAGYVRMGMGRRDPPRRVRM